MNRVLRNLYNFYAPLRISRSLTYMAQATEYQSFPFLRWLWQIQDFSAVMQRRSLEPTRAARLLRLGLLSGMFSQIILAFSLIYVSQNTPYDEIRWYGLALLVSYPIVWAHMLALFLALGRIIITEPRENRQAIQAAELFQKHPGNRIAIAGSYGKTSMKELLQTVLSEGLAVAATPANMNVVSSHLLFAQTLTGKEDVVLVEFGEGKPGDVAQFSAMVRPTQAVITGLAPAHLDQYKTLQAAGKDIFSLSRYVSPDNMYVNAESDAMLGFIKPKYQTYSRSNVLGWRVDKARTGLDGTSFELVKEKKHLKFHSGLVGLHQVGPLAFAAAFGLTCGLSEKEVKTGVGKTTPFEHRMQPYKLSGAWVIDDTYNGNLEGIRAGTELLAGLKAKRKMYITPGLVDQGKETADIHRQVGRLIAAAQPDVVVLMRNSVTADIQAGLDDTDYKGELLVQDNPLEFYTNLSNFVATGDVVLMQNDWTDNYH
ncbi:hypothetical protein IPL85_06085 [Candidatus Saccharibacteria bacterium]|nr:MAG: hypothetical protein IPL85_06085 [Candidatus Saccharibacteria bacterium]